MTDEIKNKSRPAAGSVGQLSFFKVIAFVVALFVVGGLMFAAGRMSGHNQPAGAATTK